MSFDEAKALARKILESGETRFWDHAQERQEERALDRMDCINVIRAGRVVQAQLQRGRVRYVFETNSMGVVVEFPSDTEMDVVTNYRIQRAPDAPAEGEE